MTNYIILVLCLVVLISYIFDITSKYSKIPSVILLILLGIGLHILTERIGLKIPDLNPFLPIFGTLGLVMIVMEASLDLKLGRQKISLIKKSFSAAFFLFVILVFILTAIEVNFFGYPLFDSLLNAIPLGIISSAVALSSANHLTREQKEFIVYESSLSDIVGILIFDYILISKSSVGNGAFNFVLYGVLTIIIAITMTAGLAILLHKTRYHINYVIIMTSVVMVYIMAKLSHLPALFLVLVFGVVLSNYKLFEKTIVDRYVDFEKFKNDVDSFRKILSELTFIVRSFFFIIFGYSIKLANLFVLDNIIVGISITVLIFILRWLFFSQVLKLSNVRLILFAPRGLITILLFLSIPAVNRVHIINEEVITIVILLSMATMMAGNFFPGNDNGKSMGIDESSYS